MGPSLVKHGEGGIGQRQALQRNLAALCLIFWGEGGSSANGPPVFVYLQLTNLTNAATLTARPICARAQSFFGGFESSKLI